MHERAECIHTAACQPADREDPTCQLGGCVQISNQLTSLDELWKRGMLSLLCSCVSFNQFQEAGVMVAFLASDAV